MSDNPVETEYYLRIISMYIDLGTKSVLNVLYFCKPKEDVSNFLSHPASRKILDKLRLNGVLKPKEYKLVTSTVSDPEKFDIVLLIKLLSTLFPPSDFPPPRNGWRYPPGKSDLSIAADLLRLQKIRNGVLCHRPKAQLSEFYFKHYWAELEEIIVRITQQTNPDEVVALKGRLQEYKNRDLGAYDGSEYADLLEDWDQEINEIQTQVEELLKATKEFEAYFKDKPGRYERYIRLVVDGGRLILSAVLERELKREDLSLATLLEQKEEYLKLVIRDENSLECLYSTDIAEWDIALIANVIRHGFDDLKSEDLEDIEAIQNARQNYAEIALLSLDSDRLADRREDLIGSLKSLSRGLNKEVRRKLNKVIEVCKNRNEDSRTPEAYLDNLRLGGSNIRSLADVHTETISKLKRCLKQMKREGIALKRNHRLELKLLTVDTNGDKAEEAEDDIFRVLKDAIENAVDSNGLPTVRHEIDKILNWIGASDGVTKIDTYKHCIIISVTCSTPSGILHAIEICESKEFERVLRNISSDISVELFETVSLNGYLTLESLREILVGQSENHEEDQGIAIPVTVSSADGLYRLMSLFESRKLTNSASRIAKSLSSRHGELISVQISHEFNDSDLSSSDSNDGISCKNQPSNAQVIQHAPLFKESGKENKESCLQNLEQEIIPQSEDKMDIDTYPANHELESSDNTFYMETESESSKPESLTRQSKKGCLNKQDVSGKNQDFTFKKKEKQLPTLLTNLDTLALRLGHAANIRTDIKGISSKVFAVAKSFKTTLAKEGSNVLVQNWQFTTSTSPVDSRITDIQRSLRGAKPALQANKQNLIELQTEVLNSIETCRALKKDDEIKHDTNRCRISVIRSEIDSVNSCIHKYDSDVSQMETGIAELERRAHEISQAARRKRKAGFSGLLFGLSGAMLAPFTGGSSLALGTAAAGIHGAINFNSAEDCKTNARRIRDEAGNKRQQVEGLRRQKASLEHQKSSLESESTSLQSNIGILMEASQVLQQVIDLLRASVLDIGVVLTAFEDMETELSEALLQIQALKITRMGKQENSIMDHLKEKWAHFETVLLKHGAIGTSFRAM